MAVDWKEMELGDFLELKRGYDLPKSKRVDGYIEIISSSGASGYHNESKVKAPGVVTGRYGTIGKVFYSEDDFWPLNTTLYVKDFKGNDPLFVYYLLKTLNYLEYSDKAAVPGINRNHIHKAKIKVPTCPKYQNDLALRLWNIDQKIEINTQTSQTIEQIAQAIFKSWFVDFDPVKAKIKAREALLSNNPVATPEQISQAEQQAAFKAFSGAGDIVITETLHTLTELFPNQLVESELGELPEGWGLFKMNDLVKQIKPGTNYQPKRQEQGIPFVNGKHVQNGFLDFTKDIKYITQNEYERVHKNWKPEVNDVLITRIGTLGRVGIVTEHDLPMALHYNSINIKEGTIKHPFIFFLLKSEYFQYFYHLYKKQAVQEFVTIDAVEGILINLPKDSLTLIQLTSIFENLLFKLKANRTETNTLNQLREALLPKLLSGEITLTNTNKEEVNA
ncbi:MAG: type I restriction enzyme S subunit [Cocleimonas sp.]|jgi:type I restriction enzyme S subunit